MNRPILSNPIFDPVWKAIKAGVRPITVTGLFGSARSFFLASLHQALLRPSLCLTATSEEADRLASDVRSLLKLDNRPDTSVAHLPPSARRTDVGTKAEVPPEELQERVRLLYRLTQQEPILMIAPIETVRDHLPSGKRFSTACSRLKNGGSLDLDRFSRYLVEIGYRAVPIVDDLGEFSLHGGILDIFSTGHDAPVRIELTGDTIESMRGFDPITQRSSDAIEQILILPASPEAVRDGEGVHRDTTLFQYLPAGTLVVLDEPPRLAQVKTLPEGKDAKLAIQEALRHAKARQWLSLTAFARRGGGRVHGESSSPSFFQYATRSAQSEGLGQPGTPFTKLVEILDRLRKAGSLHVVCHTASQVERFVTLFSEHHLSVQLDGQAALSSSISPVFLHRGDLASGFLLPSAGLSLLTEEDLFAKGIHHRPPTRFKASTLLSSVEDLRVGDLIVHLHHGIGRYQGLKHLAISGFESDFLIIEYASKDRLYLPLDRLDLVQKYIGPEGAQPKLDRLGGTAWARTKARVKKAVENMARELLDLYAAREVVKGHAFSQDDHLTQEFEAAFEYDETPDQLRAIEEVRSDMEAPRPMDRLVCGDVGYGKTEVALRAAFKAVLDNKQVAVLTPTTLLAYQHYDTFRRRFAPFPVRVEMLSRFRNFKEQKEILRDTTSGTMDILIGTHRILQKDVRFRDLGLLVVDEEQRFGVTHKERLKQLRKNLDVLTLTATPIPRTLQMSLAGIRDLSIIDTPPPDRLAIRTVVTDFDKRLIRSAIVSELERGGQVFFVHNRVQTIGRMRDLLARLVPEARIAVAHGHLSDELLEETMLAFRSSRCNVLLTTAIIESGLDIPAANTIIIDQAQQFGLSDLYQLRGRVGRSGRQAYAYLLVPSEKVITAEARKRLQAIVEFSQLGAGFRIAARDLEIRGAGNLLGPEQSGQIAVVGLELYLRMMEHAVQELKGEPSEEIPEPTLNLRVSAYLPEDYVPDTLQRLSLYKRLSPIQEPSQLILLQSEMEDRYGPLPQPAKRLLEVMEIKILARSLRVSKIDSRPDSLDFSFSDSNKIPQEGLKALMSRFSGKLRFLSEYAFRLPVAEDQWESTNDQVRSCLRLLSGTVEKNASNP
jgi:transcription-repair coupling factor (superfamily II helicase)